jgi:FAD/FMN-containing dehydrogenase
MSALASRLRAIVGADAVIDDAAGLSVYDCDGYTLERGTPDVVVLPPTPEKVAEVMRLLAAEQIPFVPRGAGTGLSGGTLPVQAPVMICTSRLRTIERLDVVNRRAHVQAGVVNAQVTKAAAPHGLMYAPDPSSQPMPWFNLRDMSDDDLRAMYRFIRELGPKGERAPPAAAPGVIVKTPVIVFEPHMETTAKASKE